MRRYGECWDAAAAGVGGRHRYILDLQPAPLTSSRRPAAAPPIAEIEK